MIPHSRQRLGQVLARLPRPEQPATKLLTGFGVTFALVVLMVVLSVPKLLDGTRQGQAVAAQIATATGLRVQIEGRVEVSVLPRPHIGINQLRLVRPYDRSTVLFVPRLDLNVTLASLLRREYEVSHISLHNPELTMGREQLPHLAGYAPQLQALSVRRLAIKDGRVSITGGPASETVTAINGQLVLPDSVTFLQTELNGQWRGAPLRLMIDVAAPLGTDPSLARAELDVGAAEAGLALSGVIDLGKPGWPVQAQLDVQSAQGAALWATAAALGLAPPAPADAGLRQPLQLSAVLNGDQRGYNFEGIKLSLGSWPIEGLARLVTGAEGGLSVALKAGALDLANWPTLLDWSRRGNMVLPAHWLAAFDVQVASAALGKRSAADLRFKGEVKGGAITFTQLSAILPGNSQIAATGTITTRPQVAATIDGKLNIEALQLRELLTAWQVPLPARLDDNALRQLKVSTEVRGTWAGIGLSGLQLQIDGMKLTGQISPPTRSEGFAASLAVEQLNLDHYAAAGGLPGWLWDLPPTAFNLRLARVQAGDKQAENVSLQGSVANRLLTVKSLEAADFGGNKLRLSGTISADGTQDADFTLRLIAPDFAALATSFAPAAQLVPPLLVPLLGANTDLSVRWRRSGKETQQLSSASFADGKFDFVRTETDGAPVRWKARLQNRETSGWLSRLAPGVLSRPDAILGLLDVYAEGEQAQGGWRVDAVQGQVAGISFRDGDLLVAPGAPAQISGSLQIGQGSVALLQQTINPAALMAIATGDLELAAEKIMWGTHALEDVNLALVLAPGGSLSINRTTGRWQDGQFTLSGQASIGANPSFKGQLELKETNFAWLGGDRFGLDGVLDLSARFESSGANWPELVRNLQGDGEFALDSGTLKGIDFAALAEAMLDKQSPPAINAILARGGESVLSSFGGDFNIEEGVARAPQLRLRTPAASADVGADMDLSIPRLDASAAVSLREVNGAAPFTVRLSGKLDNVVPSFDAQALTAQAAPPASAPAAAKPGEPVAQAMGDPAEDPATTQEVADVKPPEGPQPPSLDEPVAEPVAAPVEAVAAPARRPINRETNREASRTQTAAREAAPRRQQTSPAATPAGAPPSIQELLQAMPALNEAAVAVLNEAAPAAGPASAVPQIRFTPVDDAPAPRAAPARAPVSANGLAPEFSGVKPQGTRDTPTTDAPIVSPGMDVVDAEEGRPPPASVGELMGRVQD
jgi:hypothetical protein